MRKLINRLRWLMLPGGLICDPFEEDIEFGFDRSVIYQATVLLETEQ